MTRYRAALPMYDLPEIRAETDGLWQSILGGLKTRGFEADVAFIRPETEAETAALFAHPDLLLAQTCWGPISCGVAPPLHILAQPDFSPYVGGRGPLYRSAIIATGAGPNLALPASDEAAIPIDALLGKRFAFNDDVSLSGYLGITRDVAALTGTDDPFYGDALPSGSHRTSVALVAKGNADIAAIDCKTWDLVQRFDDAAKGVHVIGWTKARMGLPYVCSPTLDPDLKNMLTDTLLDLGAFPANQA